MTTFAELLDNIEEARRRREETKLSVLPEAMIARMRELQEVYAGGCPFKVGDIVSPRKDGSMRGAGLPHIVIEVFETPIRAFDIGDDISDISSSGFGSRLDCRILAVAADGQSIVPYVAESWMLEPYTGPGL